VIKNMIEVFWQLNPGILCVVIICLLLEMDSIYLDATKLSSFFQFYTHNLSSTPH